MAKLTITVEADNADQISNLLDLALKELKRESRKNDHEFTQNMVGYLSGTVGTYTVEYAAPIVDHYDWAKDFDPADPFGSNDSDKPKTPKPVEDYKHPEGWFTDSLLLINDPGQPQLTEGRLLDYLNRVRGRHVYVLLTDQGVATVERDHLRLKPKADEL